MSQTLLPKTRPKPARLVTALLVLVAGCTQVPDLGDQVQPDLRDADYPRLIPIDAALASQSAAPAESSAKLQASLSGRLQNLKRKARDLQNPVVDEQTRARMQTGVTPPSNPE